MTPIVLKDSIVWRRLTLLLGLALTLFGVLLAAGAALNASGAWVEALVVGLVIACAGALVVRSSLRARIVVGADTVRVDELRKGRPLLLEHLVSCEPAPSGTRLRFQTQGGEREVTLRARMENYEAALTALERWCPSNRRTE